MPSRRVLATTAVAAMIAASVTATAVVPAASAANTPVRITPNPAYASAPFEGWGTSLVWFANATGGYPADVRQALFDKVFGEDGLNLNIARYNIGGGNATDVPSYLRPGGAVEGYWNANANLSDAQGPITSTFADRLRYNAAWDGESEVNYDWNADATQRWWIEALKDKITHWEAFSNSPPYFLTQSGFVSGGTNATAEQLGSADMDKFSSYLVNVVEHLEDQYGIEFDTLDPFNEPNTNYWSTRLGTNGWPTTASRQEGAHIGPAAQNEMIGKLAARLAQPGTSTDVKISAMDETNPTIFTTNWKAWSADSKSKVDQLNVHTYGTGDRLVARDIAKSSDKPLWMSEVEGDWDGTGFNQVNIENGLGMAGRIVDDLRELEPSAWVFWQPVEDLYNMQKVENLNWGSVFIDFDCNAEGKSLRRIAAGEADPTCKVLTNAKYNTTRNFTHYIHPGDEIIPTDNTQTTAALQADGDGVTLVHVNTDASARDVTIDLSQFGTIAPGATVTPIVTTQSPASDPEANALTQGAPVAIDGVSKTATVSVPAKSVTTFVVSGVSGVSANAPVLRDGHTYQLLGVQSGKALAADPSSLAIRTSATTAAGATAQAWTVHTLEGAGTDRQRFVLQNRDGRLLGTSGGGTTLSTKTVEAAASDPALQWIASTTDGKTYSLLSVAGEQVLDVNGQSTADGASVGLYTSNGGSNQRWTLADVAVTGVKDVRTATATGVAPQLPAQVTLVYAGNVERTAAITWNTAGIDWSAAGSKTVPGTGTDVFGTAFQTTATVEVGPLAATQPVSLTTYAGISLAQVKGAAPTTVPAEAGTSGGTVAVPVTWDWTGVDAAKLASPGVVTVSGTATTTDPANPQVPAKLSVILTTATEKNVAPASTAAATFTESASYSVDRTKNGVTSDKGWSNWKSGTKNTTDTLTYTLAKSEKVQHAKLYFYKDGTNSWAQSITVEYRTGTGAWTTGPTVTDSTPASGTAPIIDIPLNVDADAVRFVLTANANTHMIVSEVEIYAATPSASAVADLARITVNGVALPTFTPEQTTYTVDWDGGALPTVAAIGVDRNATVNVAQATAATPTATIGVTAPSGASKTYTVAFQKKVAPALQATATAVTRCVAGKVTLVVSVENTDDVPLDVALTTAYGTKKIDDLGAGKKTSATFTSKLASVPAGSAGVVVSAVVDGHPTQATLEAAYPAASCN
ncbi:glycoside hydrolase [Microbacterium sp. B2969]|uniref:Glycoside hydrolase n=1 Tax=Microbacterium alkaliflavum TaxID=3248839 RepID=A0ABW7QBL7_9MICO